MKNESGGRILEKLQTILPWLGIIVACTLIFTLLLAAVLRLINQWRKLKQTSVLIEITPPAFQDKAPIATTQLFSVLHGLLRNRSLTDSVLRYAPTFTLEIVSTRDKGIRYLMHTNKDSAEVIRQTIQAYVTDAKVAIIDDYMNDTHEGSYSSIQVFKQVNHFAHPIDTTKSITEHDPVAYLTNAMAKLDDNELMSFQLVITPAVIPEAARIDHKIRRGHWSGSSLEKSFSSRSIFKLLWLVIRLPFILVWSMLYAFLTHDLPDSMKSSGGSNQSSYIPPAEQELLDGMHTKLNQDMFYSDLRLLVVANSKNHLKERNRAFTNSLTTYSTPQWQLLKPVRNYVPKLGWSFRRFIFVSRLPALMHSHANILGSTELGALFHFPHSRSARTENVVKSLSKTLPAPVSLKEPKDFDVILGKNVHQGVTTPIGLTEAERERHSYIIGGTGNGKTTMLLYAIILDIKAGKGVAVVDPHGDLAKTILEHIPEDRMKDVIYFDPDDVDYPIGVNLLELPADLKGSALETEKDRITESVISVFRKVFSDDDTGGHRIEYVLRNTIQTALTLEGPTIFTVFELLTNDDYRKKVTSELPTGTLKNFWKNELGKAGNMQRVKMSFGVTSKIGRFEFSVATKRVMGQPKSTIDFDDIFSTSKILICNFSKGRLGEDASALFGTAVLAKIQIAANRRDRLPENKRTPFYLYVDEFQNFATMPFVQMLSEARKYKLFLTMAEQSTAQQEEQRMVNIILANVGTVVCFRTGSPIDERLVLPLFQPFIEPGEIANLPSYSFYVRIAALQPQEPMSGETILLEEEGDETVAKQVKSLSRKQFAIKHEEQDPKKTTVKKNPSKVGVDTELSTSSPLDA